MLHRYEVLEQLPLEQLVCLALSSSSCVEQSSQISQNQGAYRCITQRGFLAL